MDPAYNYNNHTSTTSTHLPQHPAIEYSHSGMYHGMSSHNQSSNQYLNDPSITTNSNHIHTHPHPPPPHDIISYVYSPNQDGSLSFSLS